MKKGCILLFIGVVIVHSSVIIPVCKEMVSLLIHTYMPSMFILLVLAKLYIFQSSHHSYWIKGLNMDSNALALIQSMLMIGYPIQSVLVCEQYEKHHITEKQALRLIYSISLPSLAFTFMTLTLVISLKEALILYMTQFMICLFFLSISKNIPIQIHMKSEQSTFIHQLRQSIQFAYQSLANILAFLMICGSIKALLLHYFPIFNQIIIILMEFSSACFEIKEYLLPSIAFIIGFASLSIHLQVYASCTLPHFSYKTYLTHRIIQGLMSAFIIWTFYR